MRESWRRGGGHSAGTAGNNGDRGDRERRGDGGQQGTAREQRTARGHRGDTTGRFGMDRESFRVAGGAAQSVGTPGDRMRTVGDCMGISGDIGGQRESFILAGRGQTGVWGHRGTAGGGWETAGRHRGTARDHCDEEAGHGTKGKSFEAVLGTAAQGDGETPRDTVGQRGDTGESVREMWDNLGGAGEAVGDRKGDGGTARGELGTSGDSGK